MGSVDPPGGYGTTNFTGLVGQACAYTASVQERQRNRQGRAKNEANHFPPIL